MIATSAGMVRSYAADFEAALIRHKNIRGALTWRTMSVHAFIPAAFGHHAPMPRSNRLYRATYLAVAVFAAPLSTSSARAGDLVIAVAGPSSGYNSALTGEIVSAAHEAAEKLNAAGGVNGETVKVEAIDDGCDAAKASEVANQLSARNVALVLGHPCTGAAMAAAKVYAAQSRLYIATASRYPGLTAPRLGETIFRLAGRDDRQGADAARHLMAAARGKPIAIVHDRTLYARTIAEAAAASLAKTSAASLITATLISGDKDYPLVTAKIKSAAAIFFAGYPLEAGLLIRQLRASGSTADVLLSDSNATPEFASTFGDVAKGVRVLLPRFARAPETAGKTANERDIAAQRELTDTAISAFTTAAIGVKSNDAKAVSAALHSRALATPLGPLTFDASGDAARASFDVYTWMGSEWQADTQTPAAQ
jgi:branched-chain amino acid transport system substrate-binding protein